MMVANVLRDKSYIHTIESRTEQKLMLSGGMTTGR